MERGDLIAIAAGIALVAIAALLLKAGGILPPSPAGGGEGAPTQPLPPAGTTPAATESPPQTTVAPSPSPQVPDPEPYRISYTDRPLLYPVFRLPDNMETFGASEIPWKDPDTVPFAYVEENRGGLTRKFSVPYGLWGMNITSYAVTKPQYARLKMALCSAADGAVIDGMEITGPASAFRSVQVSHREMYLIIHMENVDRYRITFITPRAYYVAAVTNGT